MTDMFPDLKSMLPGSDALRQEALIRNETEDEALARLCRIQDAARRHFLTGCVRRFAGDGAEVINAARDAGLRERG